ncbi:MAG: hypothetical protein M1393_07935 [Candidatus Thermoplasmatota archaeon]|jgi:hypothetical protein|nr:hypothetical protein [Candidatus Thermoplasmatota archaeon]
MQFTYSDEEIKDLLKNPAPSSQSDEVADPRFFDYWLQNLRTGAPERGLDFKYGRYVLSRYESIYGKSEYYVLDVLNPYFSVTFEEFCNMDAKKLLPVDMTPKQRTIIILRNLIGSLIVFAAMTYIMFSSFK